MNLREGEQKQYPRFRVWRCPSMWTMFVYMSNVQPTPTRAVSDVVEFQHQIRTRGGDEKHSIVPFVLRSRLIVDTRHVGNIQLIG
jgi:hypothetical protein